MTASRGGAPAAMTAFLIWGLFPLFWSLLGDVPAFQLLAHRAAWCALAVWLLLLARGDLAWVASVTLRQFGWLALGGLLISVNWGVYVWAVVNGHVIDTSLGYFITPLVSVVIAVGILGERLNRGQQVAVLLATTGVLFLAWQLAAPPWIALTLALSFGVYGLIRKLAPFDSVRGLAVESGVMFFPRSTGVVRARRAGHRPRTLARRRAAGHRRAHHRRACWRCLAFGAQRVRITLGWRHRASVALLLGIWFHGFGSARRWPWRIWRRW
jgi:chloramphenicol-sensitive protein RarD